MCVHTHMHTHTIEYYSAIYKNEIVPLAATWMDLEIVILSKETQRNIVWYGSYIESKKKWYRWTYLQNRKRFTDKEWTYDCRREG